MSSRDNILFWLAGAGVIFLFARARKRTTMEDALNTAAGLIADLEAYRSRPYWDVTRYSWGYGTAAPGATGYISEPDARREMLEFIMSDYNYLNKLLTVPLNAHQWAALLSFSYNLGKGNADNLVTNINAGNWDALADQWRQYVYAGGVVNNNLVKRREIELNYFFM